MRILIILSCLSILLLSETKCGNKTVTGKKYKGRLEIKALCMNYTISVLEGEIDTSTIIKSWTDETTNMKYSNVFKLRKP